MRRRELDHVEDVPAKDASGGESQSPACKFRKVRLSGRSPAKGEVEALMTSLEARGASAGAPETAESSPQAGDALAKVLGFSSRQK